MEPNTEKGKAVVEPCSHARQRDAVVLPAKTWVMIGSSRVYSTVHTPAVVELSSHGEPEASFPLASEAARRTDGKSGDLGRTVRPRRARSLERGPVRTKWVKVQGTADIRVERGCTSQSRALEHVKEGGVQVKEALRPLEQVKVSSGGQLLASEVAVDQFKEGAGYVKDLHACESEIGDHFKGDAAQVKGLLALEPGKVVALVDQVKGGIGPELLGLSGGCDVQVHEDHVSRGCDDAIALNAMSFFVLAHGPHSDCVVEPGDPLLLSDVGLQVAQKYVCRPGLGSGGVADTGDRRPFEKGDHPEGSVRINPDILKKVNFKDHSATPTVEPPDGFMWQFLAGV